MDAYAGEALRYILSFDCPGTVVLRGVQWARLVVVGQSFMLHQIRKMVGRRLEGGGSWGCVLLPAAALIRPRAALAALA